MLALLHKWTKPDKVTISRLPGSNVIIIIIFCYRRYSDVSCIFFRAFATSWFSLRSVEVPKLSFENARSWYFWWLLNEVPTCRCQKRTHWRSPCNHWFPGCYPHVVASPGIINQRLANPEHNFPWPRVLQNDPSIQKWAKSRLLRKTISQRWMVLSSFHEVPKITFKTLQDNHCWTRGGPFWLLYGWMNQAFSLQ